MAACTRVREKRTFSRVASPIGAWVSWGCWWLYDVPDEDAMAEKLLALIRAD
jgi:hypothetical protein